MKTLTLAALAMLAAAPAMAQNCSSYQMGDQTYYNCSNGTNGSSYRMGDQTYYNFNGQNGQAKSCSQYQMGAQTYTNCN
jgi:hypothetical protein